MNDLTHDIEETETFHIFNLIFIDITDWFSRTRRMENS